MDNSAITPPNAAVRPGNGPGTIGFLQERPAPELARSRRAQTECALEGVDYTSVQPTLRDL